MSTRSEVLFSQGPILAYSEVFVRPCGVRRLRAAECQQRRDIVVVGSLQGGDIARAQVTGILQVGAAPRKALPAETHDEKIRHESRVSAIAVREGMNLHKPMM